jgi:hypothetical protein
MPPLTGDMNRERRDRLNWLESCRWELAFQYLYVRRPRSCGAMTG